MVVEVLAEHVDVFALDVRYDATVVGQTELRLDDGVGLAVGGVGVVVHLAPLPDYHTVVVDLAESDHLRLPVLPALSELDCHTRAGTVLLLRLQRLPYFHG